MHGFRIFQILRILGTLNPPAVLEKGKAVVDTVPRDPSTGENDLPVVACSGPVRVFDGRVSDGREQSEPDRRAHRISLVTSRATRRPLSIAPWIDAVVVESPQKNNPFVVLKPHLDSERKPGGCAGRAK